MSHDSQGIYIYICMHVVLKIAIWWSATSITTSCSYQGWIFYAILVAYYGLWSELPPNANPHYNYYNTTTVAKDPHAYTATVTLDSHS